MGSEFTIDQKRYLEGFVSGLTAAGGPTAGRLLAEMVRDPNEEVALAAAQGLAKARVAGAGSVLSTPASDIQPYASSSIRRV